MCISQVQLHICFLPCRRRMLPLRPASPSTVKHVDRSKRLSTPQALLMKRRLGLCGHIVEWTSLMTEVLRSIIVFSALKQQGLRGDDDTKGGPEFGFERQ